MDFKTNIFVGFVQGVEGRRGFAGGSQEKRGGMSEALRMREENGRGWKRREFSAGGRTGNMNKVLTILKYIVRFLENGSPACYTLFYG